MNIFQLGFRKKSRTYIVYESVSHNLLSLAILDYWQLAELNYNIIVADIDIKFCYDIYVLNVESIKINVWIMFWNQGS